jgi:hypothetical protein
MNKKNFEVEIEGKKVAFSVLRPNHRVSQQAQLVYNREFRNATQSGLMVRQAIERVLREQNLWDDEKEAKFKQINRDLWANEKKLAQGGIPLSVARDIAIQMREQRNELRQMTAERNELDEHTAEAYAERARFNYLMATLVVYSDTGKPYFRDVDDYLSRENDPVIFPASQQLGNLLYGLEDDYLQKLPENRFLIKYGFCRASDLRLIRKDGRPIDDKGRLIDDKGRLVNEAGQLIDIDGNLLTEEGEFKVEFTEFVDDLN